MFQTSDRKSRVTIRLLGDCQVIVDGKHVSSVPRGLYAVAAYLLIEGAGHPMQRRSIGQILWSENEASKANADVRQTIARIRRFQAKHNIRFIEADSTMLWFAEDPEVSCDLVQVMALLEDPSASASVALCEIYGGELLGWFGSAGPSFEDWLSFQRSNLHDELIRTVSRAILPGTELTRQQRDRCARRLLKLDPCHEGAYRALMRGAAEMGEISTVRHLFEHCTQTLREDLGVTPDEETIRLFDQLVGHRATAAQ